MNASSFFLATAMLFSFGASAQNLVAGPDGQARLSGQATAPTAPGSVAYFGVVTSQDVHHEQFGQLRQAFATFQPTLVVVEKPDLGTAATAAATIATKGVPGYTRLLAQQHQVPTERLDDPAAEYAYLRSQLSAEQLKLYYLLREARRFRLRTGAGQALTTKAMNQLLAQSAHFLPGTENTLHNVAELAAAFQKHCPTGGQWWNAPATYFCPQAAGLYPVGSFVRTVNDAINEYRARYVYAPLAARAQAGERILVVTSCDQLPAAPAAPGAVAVN
ncbi:MAG: hypothetical protein EOO36_11050 [Cytophagaceae bacterium]|nr:MAG: hypothetical protein EOO36_11050 [Cytophagaceae bacterium]